VIALPSAELVTELTQLLYYEASLLDVGLYEEWLDLLHEDVAYVAPIREDVAGQRAAQPSQEKHALTFFNDNLGSLRMRVAKIRTGLSQTEIPSSRVVRLVSNIQVGQPTDAGDHAVRSAFLIYRQHRQRQVEMLAGHRRDRWRRGPQGWRLAYREVAFAANVLPVKSLPLFYLDRGRQRLIER
jgi:3-phenylpropionate/cinnamic acid dioxygenase small subunit